MDEFAFEIDGIAFILGSASADRDGASWHTDPVRSWLIINLSCAMDAFAAADGPRLYLGAPTVGEFSWFPRGASFGGRYGRGVMAFLEIGAPPSWQAPRWPRLAAFEPAVAQSACSIAAQIRGGRTAGLAFEAKALWRSLLVAEPVPRCRRGAILSDARFIDAQRAVAVEPSALRSARDLAAWTGAPLDGLDRTFLEAFGVSAAAYIEIARLRRARRLLSRTNRPIAEIALSSGFASHAHLADRMRSTLGLSPSSLRALRL